MAERLWKYNVRATIKYKYPVWSCVIYLTRDATVEAFFCRDMPDGRRIHQFNFSVIKLWEIPTEVLLQEWRRGLAPLLVLTQDGQNREAVERSIAWLTPPDGPPMRELLTITRGLASLMLKREEDQEWIDWRFDMLFDILADTPTYRRMGQKYLEEGIEKGLVNDRLAVLEIIEARFADPALVKRVRTQVEKIKDLETLRHLVVKVALLQQADEVMPLIAQFVPSAKSRKRTTPARGTSGTRSTSTKKITE